MPNTGRIVALLAVYGGLASLHQSTWATMPTPAASPSSATTPTPSPSPAAEKAPDAKGNVLAGPKVEPPPSNKGETKTLIEREFDGKLKRLEANPAVAALALLDLTPEEREATARVIAERDAVLDRAVRNHLKELTQVAAAAQSGDRAAALKYLQPIIDETKELRERGGLVDEIADILPAAKGTELKRLTREYWTALVKERMESGDPEKPGKSITMKQAIAQERLRAIGDEVRRSYERTFGLGAKQFEELIGKLGLTPEQESKVRAAVIDHFQSSYGKPTKRESTAVFLKVYALLDAPQRETLLRYVRSNQGLSTSEPATDSTPKPAPGKDEIPVPASNDEM